MQDMATGSAVEGTPASRPAGDRRAGVDGWAAGGPGEVRRAAGGPGEAGCARLAGGRRVQHGPAGGVGAFRRSLDRSLVSPRAVSTHWAVFAPYGGTHGAGLWTTGRERSGA